ncbi:MAG: NYN domain-containing protein [Shewanella sp.]
MKRIALFVDVQNIYYTCREAYQRQFNYRKLWQQLSAQGEIVSAIAYAIHRGDDGQLKFQDALRHIGFELKLKPFIQGDWDVGITIDVLEMAPGVDTVILLSGDGDFALLLDKIRQKYAVEAEVYGVPSLTAKSLMEAASCFNPIEESLLR